MRQTIGSCILAAVVALAGCSTNTAAKMNPGGGGGGDGGVGGMNPMVPQLPSGIMFGTYISLGDSISDHGGIAPFFYDLLYQNDDSTYPTWHGHDLSTKYPNIMNVHAAKAGAQTDNYTGETSSWPTLAAQVTGLGSNYPGNVLITITIGGNDLQRHSAQVISMQDMDLRTQYAAHLASALTELSKPGRLGTGSVYIILANIYDFTDGKGDFKTVMCPPGGFIPDVTPEADSQGFGNWNSITASAIGKVTNGFLFDMHGEFTGHGFNAAMADQWYDGGWDCIHPNAAGHAAIRRYVWQMVTGEVMQ